MAEVRLKQWKWELEPLPFKIRTCPYFSGAAAGSSNAEMTSNHFRGLRNPTVFVVIRIRALGDASFATWHRVRFHTLWSKSWTSWTNSPHATRAFPVDYALELASLSVPNASASKGSFPAPAPRSRWLRTKHYKIQGWAAAQGQPSKIPESSSLLAHVAVNCEVNELFHSFHF